MALPTLTTDGNTLKVEADYDFEGGMSLAIVAIRITLNRRAQAGDFTAEYANDLFNDVLNFVEKSCKDAGLA